MSRNLFSGLLFIVLGGGAAIISSTYRMGTLREVGPGAFPTVIGAIVALIGVVIAARALRSPDESERLEFLRPRALLFVIAGIVAFALLVDSGGLVVALAALVFISSFAGPRGSFVEFVAKLVGLAVLATGIFVYGLNIPFKMWPW